MRCECCDKELNDSEATAKFVGPPESKLVRYVGMCKKCRSYLPPEVRYTIRRDLPADSREDAESKLYDPFDLGDMDDESW
jgi:uncharacterized protein with PIN domain